jgi:hypothetical protein
MMYPSSNFLRISLAACLCCVLNACSTLSALNKPPRVSLQPVQIQLLEQRDLTTVRIQNPNPIALPIHGLDYAINQWLAICGRCQQPTRDDTGVRRKDAGARCE